MADILSFALNKRRPARRLRKAMPRGEIVIFHGVRIDRTPSEPAAAEPGRIRPTPGRGR